MYVIGKSKTDFIQVYRSLLADENLQFDYAIKTVIYGNSLEHASTFLEYDSAKLDLQEIKTNIDTITFRKDGTIKEYNDFDKSKYVSELKIFELTANEVVDKDEKLLIGYFAEYEGYKGTIEYNPYDDLYYGTILDINDDSIFHAEDVIELYDEFKRIIDLYNMTRETTDSNS